MATGTVKRSIELTWFAPGVGEFFHFTWGLERKQGPCIWGMIRFFFYSKANAPYFPGVGVSIDRCIKVTFLQRITEKWALSNSWGEIANAHILRSLFSGIRVRVVLTQLLFF